MTARQFEVLAEAGASTAYEASPARLAMEGDLAIRTSGHKIVGPAFTVRCEAGDNLAIHRALQDAHAGDVLVIATGSAGYGYWGEVTTVAAMARGLAGLVIDGGVRDLAAIRELGFPVWSRAVAIRGTVKVDGGSLREAVHCGGVVVYDRDVIVADEDGVAVIPAADVKATAQAAARRMAVERSYLEQLRHGHLTLDLLDLRQSLG